MQPKHYAIIAGVILFLIITIQNIGSVRLAILFWDFNVSLILILYCFLLLGLIAGYAFGAMRKKRDHTPPED